MPTPTNQMIDPRPKTISTASKSGTTVTSPATAVTMPTTFSQRRQLRGDQPGDRHEEDPDAADELVAAAEAVGDGVEGRPDGDGPVGVRGGEVGDGFDPDVRDHPGGEHQGGPDRREHHRRVREHRRVGESLAQRESERDECGAEHDEDADVPGEQRPLVSDEEVDGLGRGGVGVGVVGERRREHDDAVEEGAGGEQRCGATDAGEATGFAARRGGRG